MERKASAKWQGGLKDGKGTLTSSSGVLKDTKYSFSTRFENEPGTNPEELIAAAHAGCFSMAFSKGLADAGHTPTSVETTAKVHLDKTDAGMTVTRIDLESVVDAPGLEDGEMQKIAQGAKENCPISRLLSPGAEITLSAQLA
jgi:lipoyl-dependent peroxiredoxin